MSGRQQYVYAMVSHGEALVKFGITTNPFNRLRTLRSASGLDDLDLYGYVPTSTNVVAEMTMHDDLRLRQGWYGEWYPFTSETVALAEEIKAGVDVLSVERHRERIERRWGAAA